MDFFGETDPRLMPKHLFWNCKQLDFATALRADIGEQNYSVCPRHWYVDATISCAKCASDFCFTAEEQKNWYERQKFWISSFPKRCKNCQQKIRRQKSLMREFYLGISEALETSDTPVKQHLVNIVDEYESLVTRPPYAMLESRSELLKQIAGNAPE